MKTQKDGHLQPKERDPQKKPNPADILILDF